jgi:ribonuclease P/MRP protein subunit POP7
LNIRVVESKVTREQKLYTSFVSMHVIFESFASFSDIRLDAAFVFNSYLLLFSFHINASLASYAATLLTSVPIPNLQESPLPPMARSKPKSSASSSHPKLPRLPDRKFPNGSTMNLEPRLTWILDLRISKRPLLRPPIPSPYASASSPKVVYISASTPFISAVKRVQKLLALADKRSTSGISLLGKNNGGSWRGRNAAGGAGGASGGGNGDGGERARLEALGKERNGGEQVCLKATGRAVEKLLGLGTYFLGVEEGRVYKVRVVTGSGSAVDDIVEKEEMEGAEKEKAAGEGHGSGERNSAAEKESFPEARIRRTSTVMLYVSLK